MADDCPDPESLAAYIEGVATVEETKLIAPHLSGCDRCTELVTWVIASKIAIPDPAPKRE